MSLVVGSMLGAACFSPVADGTCASNSECLSSERCVARTCQAIVSSTAGFMDGGATPGASVDAGGSTAAAVSDAGVTAPGACPGMVAGPGAAELRITFVPAKGTTADLQGLALHVVPDEVAVVVYLHVDGLGWWVKPYFDAPVTRLGCDGSWTADVTTGGVDETADQYAVFLVPSSFLPPLTGGDVSLDPSLERASIATVHVTR